MITFRVSRLKVRYPPESEAKPRPAVTGALLVITVLFYWKILLSHQFSLLTGYEAVNQAYSWFNFLIASLQHGAWPLWDPYSFSGHVFSGEMQTGAFYPLYLLMAIVPFNRQELLSPTLYHILFAGTHFLAAWFMLLLARELGIGRFPALIAGICFSLGGFLARLPGWPHLLQSSIWLPLIFLYLLRAIKAPDTRRSLLYAGFSGFGLGLSILAGGLHVAIMQTVVVVTAAAFSFWRSDPAEPNGNHQRRWARVASVIGTVGAIAALSGAVQLLPSMEYSHRALRFLGPGAVPASERIPYYFLTDRFFAHGILSWVMGFPYSGQVGSGEAINPYLGVFPLQLAAIGIWKRWCSHWVPYLAGLAVASFAYALGSISLLHGVLYALTPYLWLAREATRFVYLADFAVSLLAAFGAEVLFSGALDRAEWKPLSRCLQWVAVAAVLALVVPAVYGQPGLNEWSSLSLVLIVASCGLFFYLLSGHTGPAVRVVAIALILFDLYAFDWSAVNRMEAAAKGTDEMTRLLSCRGLTNFLKSQPGLFRVQIASNFAPNIGDAFDVQTTGGGGVTLLTDYAQFMGHTDLLNVRYVIKPAMAKDSGVVYQDASWKVYEDPRAYPRAWLVHEALIEPKPAELLKRLNDSGIDPHRTALLETQLDTPLDPASEPEVEHLHFEKYEANQLDLSVHVGGRALLVLSEIYYPGWTASVNGQPARIWKVDGALRGIVVPTGNSHVSLSYRPASIYVGGALTVACFGLLLPILVLFWLCCK